MEQLLSLGYQKSIELLKHNSTTYGFQAAPVNASKPEYSYLFGRDSSICALATLTDDDAGLAATAEITLESLRQTRSALGQVPFRVDLVSGYRDFWYPGNLDSTLWWVLACLKLVQTRPALKQAWQSDIEQSLTWLRYQDAAEIGLLMQGQRSDWADEMPNHGAVLYSNALWYKVVAEYVATYGSSSLVSSAYQDKVKAAFNMAFWPYEDADYESPKQLADNRAFSRSIEWAKTDLIKQPYYISYLSRRAFGHRCDLFANTLAMLFGLTTAQQQLTIERFLWSAGISKPYPGKAIYPVVYPGEPEWQEGMASRNQNIPYQYHNGGIWPYIGGFWVTYLALKGQSPQKHKVAQRELTKLAQANSLNDWEFNEYLHGELGTPMGIAKQSWNAAMYVMAHQAVTKQTCILAEAVERKPIPSPSQSTDLPGLTR